MDAKNFRVETATMLELVLYTMSRGGERAKAFFEAKDEEIVDLIQSIPVVEFVLPA